MRILMLSPHAGVRSAIPTLTQALVDALVSLGCTVVTEPWGRHQEEERLPTKLISRSRDIARLRRRLTHERFDVMVIQTAHDWPGLIANVPLLIAGRRRVPHSVVQFHGGRSDLLVAPGRLGFKAASAALFALSDGVLFLSTQEQRESLRFWPRGSFRVVANPVVRPADPHALQARRVQSDGQPLSLLYVGRLIEDKGIFELLEAFASVADHRECQLVIVGDGPSANDLSRQVRRLHLEDKVSLPGFLSGTPLAEAYRNADVFVLPSYREGFPTAVTEALAVGLPVVTTRTRGMADHLAEGENVLLVSPRDPVGLAGALERILSDGDLRVHMSRANLAKVSRFAPQVVAEDYLQALTEIIRGDSTRVDPPSRHDQERVSA